MNLMFFKGWNCVKNMTQPFVDYQIIIEMALELQKLMIHEIYTLQTQEREKEEEIEIERLLNKKKLTSIFSCSYDSISHMVCELFLSKHL